MMFKQKWDKCYAKRGPMATKVMDVDLRKLIKYEERMGVNIHQDDYYEGLFRRTTASYRAKVDKDKANKLQPVSSHHNTMENSATQTHSSLNKGSRNKTKSHHSEGKENEPTTSKASNTSYKELLEKNGKHNRGEENGDPKSVLENYYQDWQTEQTLKRKNDQLTKVTEEDNDPMLGRSDKGTLTSKFGLGLQENNASLTNSKISATHGATGRCLKLCDMVIEELRNQIQQYLNKSIDEVRAHHQSSGRKTASSSPSSAGNSIKRLPRDKEQNKPQWQNADREQGGAESSGKEKTKSAKSSSSSSNGRTTRSRSRSQSALVSRSSSQIRTRKPLKTDPVALYQYYKNEWEHFRKQIPGETTHQRVRWQVKQRMLDSE